MSQDQQPKATVNTSTGFTTTAGNVTVYNYDVYGAFTNSLEIYRNVGLSAPSQSTFIAPPEPVQGKVAVFNQTTNSWTLEEDNRGLTVYGKKDGYGTTWTIPGPISSDFTTLAPKTEYDHWDNISNTWVTDEVALHKALVTQALSTLNGQVQFNLSILKLTGQTPGPIYSKYIKGLADIAWGKDTTSSSLPTEPSDPTL